MSEFFFKEGEYTYWRVIFVVKPVYADSTGRTDMRLKIAGEYEWDCYRLALVYLKHPATV
jgi:hypothetical protein